MGKPRVTDLFKEIAEKTERGILKWEPTADANTFVTSVKGEYSFVATWLPDYPFPWIEMRNSEGRQLVKISRSDLPSGPGDIDIEAFFELVRRQALRVDESVEDALNALHEL